MINHSLKNIKKQTGNNTVLFVAIGLIAILVGFFVQTGSNKPTAYPEFGKMIIFPTAKPIKHNSFTDHQGQTFNEAQLKGKWSILFFGFTNCPDICPSTLQTLKQVKQQLEKQSLWQNYQVVMVSVDPDTDTTERLSNYVPFFDSEFIGIVDDVDATMAFAKQMGILFIKRAASDNSRLAYDVDHSASMVLLNPEGQWAGVIGAPHKADEISADLAKLAKFVGPVPIIKKAAQQTAQINKKTPEARENKAENYPADAPPLVIESAWIRPAPPNVTSLAAYFEIINTSDNDITIVDSSSPAFDATMIHNTVIENGVARMEHMDGLTIPAKGSVLLAPLSTHMMLMRPETPLRAGDTVSITLVDEDDNEYDYQVSVRTQPE